MRSEKKNESPSVGNFLKLDQSSPLVTEGYSDVVKKKKKVVKMTFEIDYEIVKRINKTSRNFGFGFKKKLVNNALAAELNRLDGIPVTNPETVKADGGSSK